jgi:rRNA maturation endonuclease Nob1
MTSLDPDEIKRVKVHPVKCSKCKLTVMVKLDDKVCPACGTALPVQKK